MTAEIAPLAPISGAVGAAMPCAMAARAPLTRKNAA
jgi:hypothetical protein